MNNEDKTEFTEQEVASGMLETVVGERHITVEGLGDLILKYPTKEDEYEADLERSRQYTRLILDGLKTDAEMEEIAHERGIWTREDEERAKDVQSKIIEIRTSIDEEKGTKKKKLQKELLELRNESTRLNVRKQSIFGHTVESKATHIWWQFLVFRCTYREEDGERVRVWKNWKAFLEDTSTNMRVVSEFIVFYHGLTDNFFDSWLGEETEQPENGESDGE